MKLKKVNKNQFLGLGQSANDSLVGPPVPENYENDGVQETNKPGGNFFNNLVNNAGSILGGWASVKNSSNQQNQNQPPQNVEKDNTTTIVLVVVLVAVAIGFGVFVWKTRK
ncbi:MAG: hypothetical protein JXR36_01280 [Bacteroidales bacterium]|nr:hypothetical protein [Bacteroidales bacterium]